MSLVPPHQCHRIIDSISVELLLWFCASCLHILLEINHWLRAACACVCECAYASRPPNEWVSGSVRGRRREFHFVFFFFFCFLSFEFSSSEESFQTFVAFRRYFLFLVIVFRLAWIFFFFFVTPGLFPLPLDKREYAGISLFLFLLEWMLFVARYDGISRSSLPSGIGKHTSVRSSINV